MTSYSVVMNLKTIPEAARRMGVSERTMWRYIRQGKLTRYERAGRVMVDMDENATCGHCGRK